MLYSLINDDDITAINNLVSFSQTIKAKIIKSIEVFDRLKHVRNIFRRAQQYLCLFEPITRLVRPQQDNNEAVNTRGIDTALQTK